MSTARPRRQPARRCWAIPILVALVCVGCTRPSSVEPTGASAAPASQPIIGLANKACAEAQAAMTSALKEDPLVQLPRTVDALLAIWRNLAARLRALTPPDGQQRAILTRLLGRVDDRIDQIAARGSAGVDTIQDDELLADGLTDCVEAQPPTHQVGTAVPG